MRLKRQRRKAGGTKSPPPESLPAAEQDKLPKSELKLENESAQLDHIVQQLKWAAYQGDRHAFTTLALLLNELSDSSRVCHVCRAVGRIAFVLQRLGFRLGLGSAILASY